MRMIQRLGNIGCGYNALPFKSKSSVEGRGIALLTLSSSPFHMHTFTPDALSFSTWSLMRAFKGDTTKTELPTIFDVCPPAPKTAGKGLVIKYRGGGLEK